MILGVFLLLLYVVRLNFEEYYLMLMVILECLIVLELSRLLLLFHVLLE